jgi:hypothetical protein
VLVAVLAGAARSLGAAQDAGTQAPGADAFVRYVRERAADPFAFVLAAFESHRIVFLGDVHPSAEPKRLVARLVPALRARGLLDVLVLEVPTEQQPVIDAYLRSEPEDVGVLLEHPLTLRAHWGASREYLEIYRAVWAANRQGGGRPIRIVAADAPRGPPQVASPRDAVARYARRDAVMAARILRDVLGPDPGARVLLFLGGYHGLRGVVAEAEWSGARATVTWLVTRLAASWPEPVYTILADGAPEPGPYREGPSRGATRWYEWLRARLGPGPPPFVVPFGPAFGPIERALLEPADGPIAVRFVRAADAVGDPIDAYLYLGDADPVTPLPGRP